jgi:hypothetical protein
MPDYRKYVAVTALVAFSFGLTAFWNGFAEIIPDFAANLYFTGFASLGTALLVHQLVIRRILPRGRLIPQLAGVFLSGLLSIILYDWFLDVTAHITYLQREGSGINWGDDGRSSGLPRSAFGLGYSDFWSELPRAVGSAVIYGVGWFPILVLLECWAYPDPESDD